MKSKQKKHSKVSSAKLANKQHNKLAKQGKLRTKLKKRQTKSATKSDVNAEEAKQKFDRETELSDDDLQFYSSKFNRSFARGLDSESGTPTPLGKRKERSAPYERQPRKFNGTDNGGAKRMKMMLPIKSHDKLIPQMLEEKEDVEDDVKDDKIEESEELELIIPTTVQPLTSEDLMNIRREKLTMRKQMISRLANLIISSPQENVGKLKDLRSYLHEKDIDVFITVKKWTMVSLMEVFVDIIPDYKIRLLTEEEQKQSMKKDTKALVEYEKALIHNYRQYLEFLEKTTKGKLNSTKEVKKEVPTFIDDADVIKVVSTLAVRCLCRLLIAHPYFNYNCNIVTVITPLMMADDSEKCDVACETVKTIFKQDKKGIISLEIIRVMGRSLKSKNFNVSPKVLNTCLSLNIREIDMSTAAERREEKRKKRQAADKMSRREKRLNKKKAILENELLETRATEDKEKTLKMHTEVIKSLFLSYFRILKNASHSSLMPAVLEGLAKFAHLINVEFFDDLFAVFNTLIQSGTLKYRELLHCVQTAFTILTGQGSVLNVDPTQFYRHFYANLFHIHAGKSCDDLPIVLGCLDIMLRQRKRQVSLQRVLAFMKRVSTMSLQQLPHGSVALLDVVRGFVQTYPKGDLLFDADTQGSGIYLPELDDPEYCNPQNTVLWELSLLQRHYHKQTAQMAHHVSLRAPSTGQGQLPPSLSRRKPMELFVQFDQSEQVFDDRLRSSVPKKRKSRIGWQWIQDGLQVELERIVADVPDSWPLYTR